MSLKSYWAKTNKSPMIVPSVSMTIKIKRTLTIKTKTKKKGSQAIIIKAPINEEVGAILASLFTSEKF